MTKKYIGILGGSFNPAHEGHKYISKQAIKLLGLDEVWWFISPQNPLKSKYNSNFEERLKKARDLTKDNRQIIISDFENQNNYKYTIDSLNNIKLKHPDKNFVWLMGADNLLNFHKWKNWNEIFNIMPIAVFDRNEHADKYNNYISVKPFLKYKITEELSKELPKLPPPAWCFLSIKKHPSSSSNIRNKDLTKKL